MRDLRRGRRGSGQAAREGAKQSGWLVAVAKAATSVTDRAYY